MAQENERHRIVTEQMREEWDSASAGWKKWWEVFDRAAQHVSDRLVELAQIKPGDRVLDIATGTGEPGITAARRVGPTGRVIATDQSSGMLAMARERAARLGLNNIEFRQTDAQALSVEERNFNAVLCRWGLMFMPDLNAVLSGLRERLVPNGRIATAVWSTRDKMPMMTIANDAIRKIATLPPPPADMPNPLRLADTSILSGALEASGFAGVTFERLNVTFEYDSPEVFTQFRQDVSAGFRATLAKLDSSVRQKVLDAITEGARAYMVEGGKVRTTNEAILFSAHRKD